MSGGTIAAIIAGSVVVVGGGATATYLILRKRPGRGAGPMYPSADRATSNFQAAQIATTLGPAAASGKSSSSGLLMNKQLLGAGAAVLNKYYPGVGSIAKDVVSTADKYIGTGLAKKIPGVNKIGSFLKLW